MEKLLCSIGLMFITLSLWAVPARRKPYTVIQPDGKSIVLMKVGDEHGSFVVNEERQPMYKDSLTGFYLPMSEEEVTRKREASAKRRQASNARRAQRLASTRVASAEGSIGNRSSYNGNKKGLVILVNFADAKFVQTHAELYNMFNQEGYSLRNHIGSVRDFFKDQSYGKLTIDFDIVGPVDLSKNYAYYGENDDYDNDLRAIDMVKEACLLAKDSVNFADYDWDGNGYVDQVFVVYAGYGENVDDVDPNTIWPHEYSFEEAGEEPLSVDGVKVNTYACSSELAGNTGKNPNGIGVACHEFSHCLGLMDTYDTIDDGKETQEPSNWDLMCEGSYNGPAYRGEVPCGYTAYERWMSGWLEWTVLDAPCKVSDMPSLEDSPCAYIIYNDGDKSEAYMLENRQAKGWYTYPDSSGLLIFHLDYDDYYWNKDILNTVPSHPRYSVVPANGKTDPYYWDDVCGQIWPYQGKDSLTNKSNPSAKVFNKNTDGSYFLNHSIEKIRVEGGKVSFTFDRGIRLEAPQNLACEGSLSSGLSLSWSSVENAEYYEVKVEKVSGEVSETKLLSESMGKLTASSDGSDDVSSSLNNYMSVKGWTGSKVFVGSKGAKLGSSKASGVLKSPKFTAEGDLTVFLQLSQYGDEDKNVTVALYDSNRKKISSTNVQATGGIQTATLSGAKGTCYIQITTTKRVYLSYLEVRPGALSVETKIYSNITENCLELKDLDATCSYSFYLRACAENVSTQWIQFEYSASIDAVEQQWDLPELFYDLSGRPLPSSTKGYVVKRDNKRTLLYIK